MPSAVEILFAADIRNVEQAISTVGKSLDKLSRTGASAAERQFRARMKGEQDAARQAEKSARDGLRSQERAAREELRIRNQVNRLEIRDWQDKEREKTRDAERASRDRERILKREAAEAKRTLEAAQRERESRTRTFGRGAGNFVGGVLGTAGRIAGTVGAIGGGFALVDSLSKGMHQETTAGQIVRSAQTTGGLNKQDVMSAARGAAIHGGTTAEDALGGLDAFVRKTGDLKVGVDMLKDLTTMASAAGVQLGDLGSVAAEAYQQLGDVDQTKAAMLALIGQGKSGAVDIRDLAQYGSRITSMANMFEGGAAKNIESFGAIAQIAKAKGGATDAAEATEAVSALFGEMGSHQKDFAGLGVKLHGKGGKLRNIEDILTETISATKGDTLKLEHLFGRRAAKAVLGSAVAYNEAGGGAAGTAAVRASFASNKHAMTMDEAEAGRQDKLRESEAQVTIAMERLHNAINERLLPKLPELIEAFTRMLPTIEDKIIPAIEKFADMLANHPWGTIIGTAIVAQIASAGIPALITAVFTRAAAAVLPAAAAAQTAAAGAGAAGATGAGVGASIGAGAGLAAVGVGMLPGVIGAGAILAYGAHQKSLGEGDASAALAMPQGTAEQAKAKADAVRSLIGRIKTAQSDKGFEGLEGATDEFDLMRQHSFQSTADARSEGAATKLGDLEKALESATKSLQDFATATSTGLDNPNAAGRGGEQRVQ